MCGILKMMSMDSPPTVIMIIYYSKWSILIHWIRVMIVRWQSGLVNIKESVRSVCDKPYHTNKKVQKGEEIEVFQNCGLTVQSFIGQLVQLLYSPRHWRLYQTRQLWRTTVSIKSWIPWSVRFVYLFQSP